MSNGIMLAMMIILRTFPGRCQRCNGARPWVPAAGSVNRHGGTPVVLIDAEYPARKTDGPGFHAFRHAQRAACLFSLLILIGVATAAVWQPREMTDQEDTTRHDRTGSLLGVVDRGRDNLPVFHRCCGDNEVIY
jgi:hypothetical protein